MIVRHRQEVPAVPFADMFCIQRPFVEVVILFKGDTETGFHIVLQVETADLNDLKIIGFLFGRDPP